MSRNRALISALVVVLFLAGGTSARGETRYALLVGINKYEHMDALQFAENDMKELALVLRKHGYEVVTMLGSNRGELQPTRRNIETQLDNLVKKFKKGDTLLVAFTGHGVEFRDEKVPYFVPVDGKPDKAAAATLLKLGDVYDKMDEAFQGLKFLLVDACRDDPAVGRTGVGAGSKIQPHEGTAALFSCSANEKALEVRELQHGLFFYAVLQKLRGEAPGGKEVTPLALAEHVGNTVPGLAVKYGLKGQKQSPHLDGAITGANPLLVLEKVVVPVPMKVEVKKPLHDDLTRDWKGHQDAMRSRGDTRPFLDKFAGERIETWLAMAENGDPKAMVLYGDCLEEGKGVGKNRIAAVTWYRKAAEKGLARGQALYGVALVFGQGVEASPREGVRWLEKAADAGDESGLYNLGQCYENGLGVDRKNPEKAAEYYRLGAAKEDTFAEWAYGQCLLRGEGVARDLDAAVRYLERAAGKDHPTAQLALALHYQGGTDRPANPAKAREYFRKVEAHNDPRVFHDIGYGLLVGEGVEKNEAQAVEWFLKAARKGNASSKMALVECYLNGRGVKRDVEEAVSYLKEALEAGHKNAPGVLEQFKTNARNGDPEMIRALKFNNIAY